MSCTWKILKIGYVWDFKTNTSFHLAHYIAISSNSSIISWKITKKIYTYDEWLIKIINKNTLLHVH